jgi:putative transposase
LAQKKIEFLNIEDLKLMINIDSKLSIRHQCEIIGLNRSTYYYEPEPVSDEIIILMNLLDKQYTATPFYGVIKMTKYLNEQGYKVGKDLVRTLLRKMSLYAIYPKRFTSKNNIEHKVYPYLLTDVKIYKPNQVWSTDITYIKLLKGFTYLVAVIDWYSRCVLSWELSNTLDVSFCIKALEEAFKYGSPEIFNTDQGSQFTSEIFTKKLLNKNILISMDSKGRAFDNIFVERLWRTVKYEDIYIKGYETISDTSSGLKKYFEFYNKKRYHQSLNYKTPWKIYNELSTY